jgi:hypothetical protein
MSSDNYDIRPLAYSIDDLHRQGSATPVIYTISSQTPSYSDTLELFFKVDSDAGDLHYLA